MTEITEIRPLEELALGQIFLYHMEGKLNRSQVEEAKDIVVQRIEEGEQHLKDLYHRLKSEFFNGRPMKIAAFTDYLAYLQFLYENKSPPIERDLQKLSGSQATMVRLYSKICSNTSSRGEDLSFRQHLQGTPHYIEVAYPLQHKGPARFIICRRKDTQRAIEKIAERLLLKRSLPEWKRKEAEENARLKTEGAMKEQEEKSRRRAEEEVNGKRIAIDDWFGLKCVGLHREDAEQMFGRVYTNLSGYGLQPDERREPIMYDGKIVGHQPPGIDNKYAYGSHCQMIQLKVKPQLNEEQSSDNRLRELDFTDGLSLLVDEMEHVLWRANCQGQIAWELKSRKGKRNYTGLVRQGEELTEWLPEHRKRVLVPNKNFY